MIRKKTKVEGGWIENHLRRMCGAISPDKRLVITVTMFLLFAALSIYITVSSIYRIGRGEGEKMQIRHIEQLELQQKQNEFENLKQTNKFNYEYEREFK